MLYLRPVSNILFLRVDCLVRPREKTWIDLTKSAVTNLKRCKMVRFFSFPAIQELVICFLEGEKFKVTLLRLKRGKKNKTQSLLIISLLFRWPTQNLARWLAVWPTSWSRRGPPVLLWPRRRPRFFQSV